jgi:AraC family transcriptional regulator
MSGNLLSLPAFPTLSSEERVWDGFVVGRYRMPPFELPEHTMTMHRLAIHARPIKIEARQEGRRLSERFLKGDLTYTSPGVQFGAQWADEREVLTIWLEPAFVARAATALSNEDSLGTMPHFRFRDRLLAEIGLALGSELKSGGLLGRVYAEALANTLAVHLLKRYSASERPVTDVVGELPKHRLRRATEFINDNLGRDIALAEIAASVEMSPYYFARLFKQSTGLAPHQYLLEQRVERAKVLLTETAIPLAEIAYQLGFASQSHFTSLFRRLTATTPKAYRKSL